MIIVYHKTFLKDVKKLPKKVKERLKERILIFGADKFNPVLNNHALKGRYQGYRSINITGDFRAIFKITPSEAIFVTINSHSNLYN